jgi:hypothetical protein
MATTANGTRTVYRTCPLCEATCGLEPGVVSIPHGWGHGMDGADLSVAARQPGVNSNLLADGELFDPLSGNAVLNGIPVRVEALAPAAAPD